MHGRDTGRHVGRDGIEAMPPLVMGGQGRSAAEVADAAWWLWCLVLLAAVLVIAWLALGGERS